MPKKNRNESIFIKPNSIKLKSLKKKNKKNFFKKDYKSLSKFSLASGIVILIFFGLPVMTNFMDENFRANIEVSNISKKNFDLTLNNKEIFKKENVDEETNLENASKHRKFHRSFAQRNEKNRKYKKEKEFIYTNCASFNN